MNIVAVSGSLRELSTLRINTMIVKDISDLELNKMCPNLTALQCDNTSRTVHHLHSLPKSLTRLILPDDVDLAQEDKLTEILPLLADTNILTDVVDPGLRRANYTVTNEVDITSSYLEHLVIRHKPRMYNNRMSSISLHCPQLTRLDIQADITRVTDETMQSLLSSLKQLTHLSLTGYRHGCSMLGCLAKLQYLKICGRRAMHGQSSKLPQSLTHLDIGTRGGSLVMEAEDHLPNLLILTCPLSYGLPKNLRELNCESMSGSAIAASSLTSLSISKIRDEKLILPDTLTELCFSSTSPDYLPDRLPKRLRRLTMVNTPIPTEWSIGHIRHISCWNDE